MKHIHTTLFIILVSCNSHTKNSRLEIVETFPNGDPRKTIEHFDNDSTCEKTYRENGKLKVLKCFRHGKQTGEQIDYYEDGAKGALMTFKNGIRDGQTYEYYPSGQIAFEAVMVNGKFEGPNKWYFKNGNPSFYGNQHLGKDTGWWYYFNPQGDTVSKRYTNSEHDTTLFFDGKGQKITPEQWQNITGDDRLFYLK